MYTASIPMKYVGPIKMFSPNRIDTIMVPLATYERPLWRSTSRGAKISMMTEGIRTVIISEKMTRSIILEASNSAIAFDLVQKLSLQLPEMQSIVIKSSRFAKLYSFTHQICGKLLYLRFEFSTGDAAGHNMVTKASDEIINWILSKYSMISYVSISGNCCTDKKNSAVNGILGRGKYVIAELTIAKDLCQTILKTTPEKILNLHVKKNLIGSTLAGSIRTANAHFANILVAIYLATGQDVANIVEGSQGLVHMEVQERQLYFSVTLPNIIVGTVGNGKNLPFIQENLKKMGCLEKRPVGDNSRRLAQIIGAAVLCGELSLLAAQTNQSELVRSHLILERRVHRKKGR